MVFEKQNGDVVVVHLGPKRQAYPEEIIRQRRGHSRHAEYLIRWNVLSSENGTGRIPGPESKMENTMMWMSTDDVFANSQGLLGKRDPREQWGKKEEEEEEEEEAASSSLPPEIPLDEASLLEMKADVRNLVERAAWQMASATVPRSSILNTVHVLSVYARIGALMDAFKETRALDLLMKMLCHEEQLIRHGAGKILRALASHDAGSRAYVLLSLSQQDDIEQRMDFDSRYTLLELFAETTSSEEHAMSFEGIPLPQIPGKQLFSLVKRYLWATSLMDELHATGEPGGECQPSVPLHGSSVGETKLRCEFDFSMAMAHLLSELMQVMGWDCSRDHRFLKARRSAGVQSIFRSPVSPGDPTPRAALPSPKESGPFESHSAFPRRSSYVQYLQEKLVRGMRVRMLQDYEKVRAGDEGEFLQSNNGTPPVQVYWESLGRMYWVHWDMIEIVGSSRHAYHKAQEKLFSLRETQRQETVL